VLLVNYLVFLYLTRNMFYQTMERGICPIVPGLTWWHRSHDHWNRKWSFPIGGLL